MLRYFSNLKASPVGQLDFRKVIDIALYIRKDGLGIKGSAREMEVRVRSQPFFFILYDTAARFIFFQINEIIYIGNNAVGTVGCP